jgi:hypothetical protein
VSDFENIDARKVCRTSGDFGSGGCRYLARDKISGLFEHLN